jgi:hypothetical protein
VTALPPSRNEIVEALQRLVRADETRVEAESALAQAWHEVRASWGERAAVFTTDEGLVWVPDYFDLQCVAVTQRGDRCRNYVFDQGQVWTWNQCFALLDDEWLGRLLTQTCRAHDDARAVQYGTPETVLLRYDSL